MVAVIAESFKSQLIGLVRNGSSYARFTTVLN